MNVSGMLGANVHSMTVCGRFDFVVFGLTLSNVVSSCHQKAKSLYAVDVIFTGLHELAEPFKPKALELWH